MAYSNIAKAEFIDESRRSQFTINHDVVNPRIPDVVNTKVEQFLNT